MSRIVPTLTRVAESPRIYVLDDFVAPDVIRDVLARYGTREALDARGIEWDASIAGVSAELAISDDPVLARLAAGIERVLGFRSQLAPDTFRFRRYAVGDLHPPHLDAYAAGGLHLVASALR